MRLTDENLRCYLLTFYADEMGIALRAKQGGPMMYSSQLKAWFVPYIRGYLRLFFHRFYSVRSICGTFGSFLLTPVWSRSPRRVCRIFSYVCAVYMSDKLQRSCILKLLHCQLLPFPPQDKSLGEYNIGKLHESKG